jgi:hypothetical protein
MIQQDWEFPQFAGSTNVKLPGIDTGDVHFHIPGGEVQITGKWFNYGIIFIVMILDLNMWKNQIFYEPYVYGQYTDSDGYIYTVCNRTWLANATREMLSYSWRWNSSNHLENMTYGLQDHRTNSKYSGFPLSLKGIAFGPSLTAFVVFGYLAKRFSREEEEAKNTQVETFRVIKSEEDLELSDDEEIENTRKPRSTNRSDNMTNNVSDNMTNMINNRSNNVSDNVGSNEFELDSFGQDNLDGVDHHVSDDKTSLNGESNRRLTMANIVRLKKLAARGYAKTPIIDDKLSNSQNSLYDNSECEGKSSFERTLSPLSSDSDDKESHMAFADSDGPTNTSANGIRSFADTDSGEESDIPKELSFDRLQHEDKKCGPNRGKDNWDKLRNNSTLSFGDLFRASGSVSQGSQDSLQFSRDDDDVFTNKPTRNTTNLTKTEEATKHLLQVPRRSKK